MPAFDRRGREAQADNAGGIAPLARYRMSRSPGPPLDTGTSRPAVDVPCRANYAAERGPDGEYVVDAMSPLPCGYGN